MLLWLPAVVMLASFLGTACLRAYALQRNILDIPNQRSSHSIPTPRGGGVAIVLSFSCALPMLVLGFGVSFSVALAFAGAGLLVAAIGFVDDHQHVPARWRLIVHFLAAGWGLFWLAGDGFAMMADAPSALRVAVSVVLALYLVWLLNLYNFMDGIDGIAGVEAISCCLGGALIALLLGETPMALTAALLAAATGGFLFWNAPPARIFMGDAGSGFLGMTLGLLSLWMASQHPQLLVSWLILLGVFLVDATATLLRRFLRGEQVHLAHRSHAYQHAARQYGKHLPVTLAVAAINLFWLLPLAVWASFTSFPLLLLILAYMPLIYLAAKYRAGLAD